MECLRLGGSISRGKRSGERGHPCCVPLEILKGADIVPLVNTLADGLEYKERIVFWNHPVIPNLVSTAWRTPSLHQGIVAEKAFDFVQPGERG